MGGGRLALFSRRRKCRRCCAFLEIDLVLVVQVRSSVMTDLSFSSHVKAVTKSAYYHLKNIAIISFVSSQDLEKVVHAFITSRVDYCNGLLTGLPKKTIRQLQLIQNAAARILTRTRKSEHITPVLRSLHWLPVTFRIYYKVLLIVYKITQWPRPHCRYAHWI